MVAVCSLMLITACHTKTTDNSSADANLSAMEELRKTAGDRVFFELDSSIVNSEGKQTLAKQAHFMSQHPNLKFIIEGHCDERGGKEYNLGLGERRAAAVENVLRSQGVDGQKLRTVSYGKERPEASGHDESSWAQNRRAVTVVE